LVKNPNQFDKSKISKKYISEYATFDEMFEQIKKNPGMEYGFKNIC
jgi:hypothetical protein